MRWKTVGLFVSLLAVAWIAYTAWDDGRQNQIVRDLTNRRDQPDQRTLPGTGSQAARRVTKYDVDIVRLTDGLVAENDQRDWEIRRLGESARVLLPFRPPAEGRPLELPSERTAADASANPGFVGPAACVECHAENYDGFRQTAHFRTSGEATIDSIPGSLTSPGNVLAIRDSDLRFTIHNQDGRPSQQMALGKWHLDIPVDVWTGSSKVGQTYLYWWGDALYQHYVSYLTQADEWIPSPGLSDLGGDFTREVRVECLECHTTFIEEVKDPNHFARDSAIWGVTCERCHGPGRRHVEFHRANPNETVAKFVSHPEQLSRDRQLDICGQCHAGSFRFRTKAFSFRPGDKLTDHHRSIGGGSDAVGSVHTANQLTRLAKSVCFKSSEMTCTTCHDPHQNERGNVAAFSQRCLQCHQSTTSVTHDQFGAGLNEHCVECHMPMGDNVGMELDTSAGRFSPAMIDHHIRIDAEATDAFLKSR